MSENYSYEKDQEPLKIVLFNSLAPRMAIDIKRLRITLSNLKGDIIDLYEPCPKEIEFSACPNQPLFTIVAAPLEGHSLEIETKHTYTYSVFHFTARLAVTL